MCSFCPRNIPIGSFTEFGFTVVDTLTNDLQAMFSRPTRIAIGFAASERGLNRVARCDCWSSACARVFHFGVCVSLFSISSKPASNVSLRFPVLYRSATRRHVSPGRNRLRQRHVTRHALAQQINRQCTDRAADHSALAPSRRGGRNPATAAGGT